MAGRFAAAALLDVDGCNTTHDARFASQSTLTVHLARHFGLALDPMGQVSAAPLYGVKTHIPA